MAERIRSRKVATVSDPYDTITIRREWVLNPEDMGSKKKFWYRGRQ